MATTCLSVNNALFTHQTFDCCIVDEASQVWQVLCCLIPVFFVNAILLFSKNGKAPSVSSYVTHTQTHEGVTWKRLCYMTQSNRKKIQTFVDAKFRHKPNSPWKTKACSDTRIKTNNMSDQRNTMHRVARMTKLMMVFTSNTTGIQTDKIMWVLIFLATSVSEKWRISNSHQTLTLVIPFQKRQQWHIPKLIRKHCYNTAKEFSGSAHA